MIFDLVILQEVESEIDEIFHAEPDAASELDLLIERLLEDRLELEYLCVPGNRYAHDPAFEVKVLEEAKRLGKNIYLVKYLLQDGSLSPYRLLIGYDAQNGTYYALQVAHRGVAYVRGSESFGELLRRYDQCGIPTYK